MPQKAYARVGWTVDDIMENAEQFEINISRNVARKILKSEEMNIMDAMVGSGWQVIEDALQRIEDGDE